MNKQYTTKQKIRTVRAGQRSETMIVDVCRAHQISEQTYHRWKAELRVLEADQAKQFYQASPIPDHGFHMRSVPKG